MYKFVDQLSYFSYVILYLFVYKIYVSNCFVYFSLAHLLQALQSIPTVLWLLDLSLGFSLQYLNH